LIECRPVPERTLRAIELFAGAGGLMLGLEAAGFSTVVANEVHRDPCKTLRRNFPEVPVVEGSIRDLTTAALLAAAGYERGQAPQIDLVAGGPPCQGFSTAGLKDPADPRNTLIGDFIRVVGQLQPRFFLLENVTGLRSLHGGRLFDNVLGELDELGYSFHFRVLHAADYGVPQMRKRLFIVGAREGAPPPFPAPTHGDGGGGDPLEDGISPHVTCGDALGDIPAIAPGEVCFEYEEQPASPYQHLMRAASDRIFNHQASRHRSETMAYYGLVPAGGTWLDIPLEQRKRKQGMQRWPLQGLARTVTSEPTDFLHPTLDRIPTIRELARIQSFPDSFEFMGQRTTGNKMRRLGYCSQSQQVGNAVPPLLAEAVGTALVRAAIGEELSVA
jgi:DNA (cytosine-5)-methyltransferase 1